MKRKKNSITSGALLIILSLVCVMILFISYVTDFNGGLISSVSDYVFVPMQKGFTYVESSFERDKTDAHTLASLKSENEKLTKQVNDLTTQLNNVQLQQSELEDLQKLYKLDQQYSGFKKTGARVIARGSSNWFNTFTINKGSQDGIKVDMNVIAGDGLVGIVTKVGKNYAIVRSIIDDTSNVSAMSLNTGDLCIASGSLERMTSENMIEFNSLEDPKDAINQGEPIVTSNISDKYLPGILIGYVNELKKDSNDITKSGTITPAVDFKHLQNVLVILQTKEKTEE
ncbi:MAG: rod shape-determining protein MreC [Lachnospiraceae bacterium]|nr:rod shape-determining protein MreC [Lachnospiraceae bacterium]MDY5704895.1 rod shape-determining protein MreC [Lachnospiraceae bacterium]